MPSPEQRRLPWTKNMCPLSGRLADQLGELDPSIEVSGFYQQWDQSGNFSSVFLRDAINKYNNSR